MVDWFPVHRALLVAEPLVDRNLSTISVGHCVKDQGRLYPELYYFPKASASWRIPDLGGGFLDEIKFRAAYGESGNLPLYGDRFTPLEATNVIGGVAGTVIPVSNLDAVVGSPTLKPERQQEVEAGIDATLLDRRASLELNVYQKNISDLIVRRRLAPSSGFGEEVFNGGKLRTRGVEVGLGITAVQSQSLNWFFRTSFFESQ